MGNLDFDVNDVPKDDFEPIPEGDYRLMVVGTELKDTKAGTGQYLEVKCQVVGGSYANRVLFHRFNVKNPNEAAVRIARKELGAFLSSCGKSRVTNHEELRDNMFTAKVIVERGSDDEMRNRIKVFRAAQGAPAPIPVTPPPAQAATPAAPWSR